MLLWCRAVDQDRWTGTVATVQVTQEVASAQTTLFSILSPVVAKKGNIRVPCNGTSRSGSNVLPLHTVADGDNNGEIRKMTERAGVRNVTTNHALNTYNGF